MLNFDKSVSMKSDVNSAVRDECLRRFAGRGSDEHILKCAQNTYQALKSDRKLITEKFNGDREAAKKFKSMNSMRSEKALKRVELFESLLEKRDPYCTSLDLRLARQVLSMKEIHSDEENDTVDGVAVRKRKRPEFRDSYPRVNEFLEHLNEHTV